MQNINCQQLMRDIEEALVYFLSLYNISDPTEKSNFETANIFTEYSGYYLNTNEPLNKIFEQVDFTNKKSALTVLSSGDHALNLVFNGISDITTFDTNRLTEYIALGYKISALKCLDYEGFLFLFQDEAKDNRKLKFQEYIFQNMPYKYYLFWTLLSKKYYEITGEHFFISEYALEKQEIAKNLYTQSKSDYEITQKKLLNATIDFHLADIKSIPGNFCQYDIIELSNILNYTSSIFSGHNKVKQKIDLLEKMYFHNLNPNGEMLFDCVFPKNVNPTGESIHEVIIYLTALKRFNLKIYKAEDTRTFSLTRKQY